MIRNSGRRLVLAFALLNGTLYSCFLPLWEGFDEPFHYAYIESLSHGQVPVFGKAKVTAEIQSSFANVPVSRMLSGSVGALSFEQWFPLSPQEKQMRLNRAINPALRNQLSNLENYEAQQAPLAYALLVPVDLALSPVQLRWRVLALRLIGAIAAALLLYFGMSRLCNLLGFPDVFALAAMSCIFASQMLWATVAHIGNDYLAVPLTLLFLVWLVALAKTRAWRDLLILSVLFSAGLLTKAYFLAFAPVFVACAVIIGRRRAWLALLIPLLTAGPWYVRNRLVYGSFSGTQQSVAGIGFVEALSAVPRIPWVSSALAFLHWSLWTGNWSFLSFSRVTLDAELILIGIALVLYFSRFRRIAAPEWWGISAGSCFLAGLAYQTCVTYIHTHGASLFAEPWYWQGVLCFIWVLAFRGLADSRLRGRALAFITVLLTAWIAALTYVAKLFPLYGGGFQRETFRSVWAWWTGYPTEDLRGVALAPPYLLYALLILLLLILAAQIVLIAAELIAKPSQFPTLTER